MIHHHQKVMASQGEHLCLVQGTDYTQGFSFYWCIAGFSIQTLLAAGKHNLEPVFATSAGLLQGALTVLLGDQEANAQLTQWTSRS